MEKCKIFEMWERQLGRLERMSEKAEYAKALSGLTDTMMELSDRLLREAEYGWTQYKRLASWRMKADWYCLMPARY